MIVATSAVAARARRVFTAALVRCRGEGLVGGEEVRGELDAVLLELVEEHRAKAGRLDARR